LCLFGRKVLLIGCLYRFSPHLCVHAVAIGDRFVNSSFLSLGKGLLLSVCGSVGYGILHRAYDTANNACSLLGKLQRFIRRHKFRDGNNDRTDFILVLTYEVRGVRQSVHDLRKNFHDKRCEGSPCYRAELAKLHVNFLNLHVGFMHLLRVKACTLNLRDTLRRFFIIKQRLRQGEPSRAEGRHEKFLTLPRLVGCFISLGQDSKLFVHRLHLARRVRERQPHL